MALLNHESLIVFSDLDGCLLNKHDYDWQPAVPALERLRSLQIPVVLASSKTVAEISFLAEQLPIIDAPFIAENGGAICWEPWRREGEPAIQQTESDRSRIVELLQQLRSEHGYRFRSFADLGIDGIMAATDLDRPSATRAAERHSTEPLLWDDDSDRIADFAANLTEHKLVLTRGGRFWHVSGPATKGQAMKTVLKRFSSANATSVAIGDSPIDQSMLDRATIPVGIRVRQQLNVSIDQTAGVIPEAEGSAGWNEALTAILDQIR